MTPADIKAAQSTLNELVMGKPGVEGTAIGLAKGSPCLKVYVSSDTAKSLVPAKVAGFSVVVEKSGTFGRL
ncbi:MAG: hypothetical protein KJO65_10585 [Gemmatimonadetes bacterium]|nr:hypothetical protein [Gemmatimonadota bacterium]